MGRTRDHHSSQQEKGMDRRELDQREPFGGQAPLTLVSDVTRYGGSETVVKGDIIMKATRLLAPGRLMAGKNTLLQRTG